VLVSAALGDGGDAGVLLEGGCAVIAVALSAEGGQEPCGEDRAGAGKGLEELEVREALAAACDLVIEVGDGAVEGTKLGEERLDQQAMGFDDGGVGRERQLRLDVAEAAIDDSGVANVVVVEEGTDGVGASALSGLERRPPGQEIDEDVGLLVAKPLQDLWKVGLERAGKTVGDADPILDEIAAGLDEAAQNTKVGKLGAQRLELVAVAKEEVEGDVSIGGIVLGTAGREGAAVVGESAGVDGEDDEEVMLEKGRDNWPLGQLDADGDGCALKASAERLGPGTDGCGAMLEDGELMRASVRKSEADVVFGVGPVDANEGGEASGLGHGPSWSRIEDGTCTEPSPAKAIWRAGRSGCP